MTLIVNVDRTKKKGGKTRSCRQREEDEGVLLGVDVVVVVVEVVGWEGVGGFDGNLESQIV